MGFNSGLYAEVRTQELKDRATGLTQSKQQKKKKKKLKIAEKTYQTVSHRPTRMNICIKGVPKGEAREKGAKNLLI